MDKKINKLKNLVDKIKNDITTPILSDFLDWFYKKLDLHFKKSTPKIFPKKGDIYFVNLGKNIGSELNKIRPCIVGSIKKANFGNTILIIPLKSFKTNNNINDFQILIKKTKQNGLEKDSIIDFSSIRQIDKKRLLNKIGTLEKAYIEKIDKKIFLVFGIK